MKYSYGARSLRQLVETKGEGNFKVLTDRGWAGDKVARKSSGCAAIQLDGVTLATRVRGQSVEALSSAEAEFHAAVMGIAEALHIQQLLAWIGEGRRLEAFSDSAAARSILSRMCGQSAAPTSEVGVGAATCK